MAVESRTVTYRDGDTVLEGYLALPSGKHDRLPMVLVVHDWNGIDDYEKMRTRMIAELGYAALAVDIYGQGVRPRNAAESRAESSKYYQDNALLRRRVRAAIDFARTLPQVDARKMAAIGYCFGGMVVLDAARSGVDLLGVVSFHGSLTTQNPAQPGTIKAEVLVLHGADDPLVPPRDVEAFKAEMKQAGAKLHFVAYPGAVHSFTVKGSESAGMPGVAYNADADAKSWEEMRSFFARLFR